MVHATHTAVAEPSGRPSVEASSPRASGAPTTRRLHAARAREGRRRAPRHTTESCDARARRRELEGRVGRRVEREGGRRRASATGTATRSPTATIEGPRRRRSRVAAARTTPRASSRARRGRVAAPRDRRHEHRHRHADRSSRLGDSMRSARAGNSSASTRDARDSVGARCRPGNGSLAVSRRVRAVVGVQGPRPRRYCAAGDARSCPAPTSPFAEAARDAGRPRASERAADAPRDPVHRRSPRARWGPRRALGDDPRRGRRAQHRRDDLVPRLGGVRLLPTRARRGPVAGRGHLRVLRRGALRRVDRRPTTRDEAALTTHFDALLAAMMRQSLGEPSDEGRSVGPRLRRSPRALPRIEAGRDERPLDVARRPAGAGLRRSRRGGRVQGPRRGHVVLRRARASAGPRRRPSAPLAGDAGERTDAR